MSGSTIGGQIPELQHLSTSFQQQAHTVDELLSALGKEVDATWWEGGAADRFRSAWESDFKPALSRLATALSDASSEVHNRAELLIQVGS